MGLPEEVGRLLNRRATLVSTVPHEERMREHHTGRLTLVSPPRIQKSPRWLNSSLNSAS